MVCGCGGGDDDEVVMMTGVFSTHNLHIDGTAVEFEHDGIVYASAQQPDDPLYPQQWAMQELRLPYAGPLGSASNDSSTQYATRAKGG